MKHALFSRLALLALLAAPAPLAAQAAGNPAHGNGAGHAQHADGAGHAEHADGAGHAEPACAAISDDSLPKAFAAWAGPAETVVASAGGATPAVPLVSPGKPVQLQLQPQAGVHFKAQPEQKRLPENAHAGIVKLRIPADGVWRIAASGPVWIDLLGPGGPIASTHHGRMAPCTTLRKVVEFPLKAGDYPLQLSGNPGPELRLLVTARP